MPHNYLVNYLCNYSVSQVCFLMLKYLSSGIYVMSVNLLVYFSGHTDMPTKTQLYILLSDMYITYLCIVNVVSITTQPMNVTVCLTQSATANFTCVVNTQGITGIFTAGWQILDGGRYRSVVGRPHHMTNHIINNDIITDTLTVTNVSVNDNGALYRCEPEDGVTSMIVTITVLGEIVICLSVHIHIS